MALGTRRRPEIGAVMLAAVVAVYLLAAANLTFWSKAWEGFATGTALAAFAAATFAIFLSVTIGLAFRFVAKPLYVFAILSAAVASYFTDAFGTLINANMLENLLATDTGEAGQFFSMGLIGHVIVFGILPSILVLWVRVRHRRFAAALRHNLLSMLVLLGVAGLLVWPHFHEVRVAMRRDFNAMMEALNPAGPVSAAINVAADRFASRNTVREPHGRDARRGAWIAASRLPVVTVIVAGESARAMNFSLNGYARPTNPELAKLDVLSFRDVTSCGTETNVSLRCMFSGLTRADYSRARADGRESLMDVLRHAGLDVAWWDNDGGSKGVADGVAYQSYMMRNDPDLCVAGTCQDDIFLGDLDERLASVTRDTVIVLHQRGSHGPAYYLRYPDTFRPFAGDCRDYDLTDCSAAEILDAYDNTIAYTDRFLARVVGILGKHSARLTGSLFYISDHGESLGEGGLYMHGTRWEAAPREQTHVPLIVWTSPAYRALSSFDDACARVLLDRPFSQDNVYHTLLGMTDVSTSVYRRDLDIFAGCRKGTTPSG
jgi:lipid A ethanolaminephosphotransferase